LQQSRFSWWSERMQHHLQLFAITRIDHFRGLVAYWEVSAGAKTAVGGRWVDVPAMNLFDQLIKRFGSLPVIAEDLGSISADVREVMRHYGFPGMRVLLFAFGDDFPDSSFLPHRHEPNCVVYVGTHDNNTVRGWIEEEADGRTQRNLFRYLGRKVSPDELPWELIRMAMMSTAETVIVSVQDILGLGAAARMNRPGRRRGNWLWRLGPHAMDSEKCEHLRQITETYGRL